MNADMSTESYVNTNISSNQEKAPSEDDLLYITPILNIDSLSS